MQIKYFYVLCFIHKNCKLSNHRCNITISEGKMTSTLNFKPSIMEYLYASPQYTEERKVDLLHFIAMHFKKILSKYIKPVGS